MRAILTYHSVDASGSVISIAPATFREHVEWLASSRVPVLDLAGLLALPDGSEGVALTFDDGFANFESEAWPLLREHGLPATLYVAADWVGRTNGWGGGVPRLPLLGWDALGRLAGEGVTLGAHSMTHADLRGWSADRVSEEVAGSADRIEARTGMRPSSFAYPYGAYDDRAVAAVRQNFASGCTTELRPLGPTEDAARLPRLDTYYLRRQGSLVTWGTRSFRRYIALRRHLRRVRGMLGEGSWR